jgi:hypothetical protein
LTRRRTRTHDRSTTPTSTQRQLASAGLALLVSLGATVAIAHATGISITTTASPDPSAHYSRTSLSTRADALTHRAAAVKRAPRGFAGPQGLTGATGSEGEVGPVGPAGPPGPPGIINQTISINWQDDEYAGRDSAAFVAPGIGRGEVVCSRNTQWINFTPYNLHSDSEMWAAIMHGKVLDKNGEVQELDKEVAVRAAARRAESWGEEFNLGLNVENGTELESEGSMVGIISSRGPLGSPGEPGPPPTTFHLAWYWSFGDSYGPRCYVAGTFETGR